MPATPERLLNLAATAPAPDSLSGIAFNRQHRDNREVWELPNLPVIRSQGPASFGGVGTARALARLYSAVISPADGLAALLTPGTVASFSQIKCVGWDLVLRQRAPQSRPPAESPGFVPPDLDLLGRPSVDTRSRLTCVRPSP